MFAQTISPPLSARATREVRHERPIDLLPLLWSRLTAAGIDVLSTGRDTETGEVRIEIMATSAESERASRDAHRAVAPWLASASECAARLQIETVTPEQAFA